MFEGGEGVGQGGVERYTVAEFVVEGHFVDLPRYWSRIAWCFAYEFTRGSATLEMSPSGAGGVRSALTCGVAGVLAPWSGG
jgi:hypothetical protein